METNERPTSSDNDDTTNLHASPRIITAASIMNKNSHKHSPPRQHYYDEEVASDNKVNASHIDSIQKNQSLDESALEINRSSSPKKNAVKFTRQLSSPHKFKLRRLNMAGMLVEDSPPRLFSNSWSFGSAQSKSSPLDGVVDDDDNVDEGVVEDEEDEQAIMENAMDTAPLQPVFDSEEGNDLQTVKSIEFNLDMIELAPSEDKHDANGGHSGDKDDEMTDLVQTSDSEEMVESDERSRERMLTIQNEDIEASRDFHKLPQHDPRDDENVGERKPIHLMGWIVVLLTMILVIPLVVISVSNSNRDYKQLTDPIYLDGFSGGTTNVSSPPPSRQPSVMPSLPQPTQSGMPSQTYSPSIHPSILPSLPPTTEPSGSPSATPTDSPSSIPSTQPSIEPSTKPSNGPTNYPSVYPTWLPSAVPTANPTTSSSPTQVFCEIRQTDGCDDYYHPTGWVKDLSCTVSNAFLTCSISSCFDVSQGNWPYWDLFLNNAIGNSFRIRQIGTPTTVMLERSNSDGSWTGLKSYPLKASASAIVFGVPIGTFSHVERLRTWLVSYDENGMDMDRIPRVGSLLFTGAGDVCS